MSSNPNPKLSDILKVRIPPAMKKKMEALASARGCSVADVCREALILHIQAQRK